MKPGMAVLLVVVALLAVVEGRLTNVTFTNPQGVFTLQSQNWPANAPPSTNHIWELTSPPGTRVSLNCNQIFLLKRVGCSEGSLTIWNGLTQKNLCSVVGQFQRESVRNKMFVQFRTGWFGVGRFSCVARVISGTNTDGLDDPDSREHGSGTGMRQTSCPCGWTNKRRIVGGRETLPNEYPFMAIIRMRGERQGFCGGSIITPRHILTAAHCVHGNENRQMEVMVGAHDTRRNANTTQILAVTTIRMHENYDHSEMTDDVCILGLSQDIRYNQFVGPICLPSEKCQLTNTPLKILGWGRTSTNGVFSNVLLKVNVRTAPLETCAARYSNKIDLINPTQICTYSPGRDSCQGDSGGPLVINDPDTNRMVQCALVSYGKDCGSIDGAVNADVHAYYDWIQVTINRMNPNVNTCEKI